LLAIVLHAQQGEFAKASWIAAGPDSESTVAPAKNAALPIFRKTFVLPAKPVSAVLKISGLGQYEAHINGRDVTAAVLTPGWTVYTRHVLFDTFDVNRLLQPGANAIGVMLGNGMYRVLPSPGRYSKFERSFGQPKLIAELRVRFANRPDLVLSSGPDWSTHAGPITFSNIYGGEDFDARLEPENWDTAHFNDSRWSKAVRVNGPGGVLIPETTPPIEAFETFKPVKITHPSANVTVYDLGQNFAGWPEIEVTGPRGASVKLLAGELLTPSGFVTQHSANAGPDDPNLFTYTLRGGTTVKSPEQWHPRFSYYGFRYVQAETSANVTMVRLQGRFLHDAVTRIGTFTSSDVLFNRIHALIDNAMLSNMVSVLTDCPHREKLGWLEESHLAGTSLNYNWNLASLFNKISDDMRDSQQANGLVPSIAPEFPVFSGAFRDSPEWGSAVILTPWIAYQFSGNSQSLRDHYASMQRYIAYLGSKTRNHLLDYGLGDWYDIGPGEPGQSKLTTLGFTASAIYYQDLTTLARIAVLTGHPQDAGGYTAEALAVKSAFDTLFFHPDINVYDRGSQTAQAMPLSLGLVPQGHEAAVLASLVASIRVTRNHVTAGDVGYHYLVRALTDFGRSDVLFDMLSRTDPPSYGAQVAAGVTSLAEAWDANPNDSQNHFMLGDAEEWFYRGLAGVDFDRSRKPGDQIRITPAVVGTITSASAILDSSLGPIKAGWHRENPDSNILTVDIEIPAGASGRFILPFAYRGSMEEAGRAIHADKRIRRARDNEPLSEVELSSGRYRFILRRG
jgi:alpha-L-rhamnosidase